MCKRSWVRDCGVTTKLIIVLLPVQEPVINDESSFPVIYKIDISVQLLMRINRSRKWLPVENILMQLHICHDALN